MTKEMNQPQNEEILKNEEIIDEMGQNEENQAEETTQEETENQELTAEEQLANILTSLTDTNGLDRNNLISKLNECYTSQAQQWGAAMLTERYGEDFTSGALQKTAQGAFEEWKSLLIADAHKELAFGDVSTDIVEDFTAKVKKTEIESL